MGHYTIVVTLPPAVAPTITHSERHTPSGGQPSCTIRWTDVSTARHYDIRSNTGQVHTNNVVGTARPPNALFGTAACGTSHTVRACNVAGCGAWSSARTQEATYGPAPGGPDLPPMQPHAVAGDDA